MNKRLLIILIILVILCISAGLFLRFYLTQHLFIKPKSDQDLLEILFDADFPGYSNFEVLDSEGEGLRRIPRQMQIAVTIETYPEPLVCDGEVYYAMGDPMALNVQWHTIECVGQMVLMERARLTMNSGLELDRCYSETINNLLVYWIREEIITPKDILSPELRKIILDLASDDEYIKKVPPLDAGLFDTGNVVVHQVVDDGESSEPAYVLRCDGSVDVYLVKYWNNVYQATKRNAGDIFLPDTLTREEVLLIQAMENQATPQIGVEVEVTVIAEPSCSGWTCDLSGTFYEGSVEEGNILPGIDMGFSQHSYCSPTAGDYQTKTDEEGKYHFEIYLHDTDQLTFSVASEDYLPYTLQVNGMDCLYCSCFPLDHELDPLGE